MKVAVLMGGTSSEREVSLMSGKGVLSALQSRGFDCISFDPATRSVFELSSLGVTHVFIALHGRFGEDGTLQGALEVMGIPYTGSGVLASALALDKERTKRIWSTHGIPTAAFEMMHNEANAAEILERLGGHVFVKPVSGGSTIGMTSASSVEELRAAYKLARSHDDRVLVERRIEGRELTVSILERAALPITEIVAPQGNYDYQNKYFTDVVKYVCPAHIPEQTTRAIQADALRAFDVLGCYGWARADVMLNAQGEYFFLEINTAPGMTGHSLVPIAARAVGLDYPVLCEKVLRLAKTESGPQHVE